MSVRLLGAEFLGYVVKKLLETVIVPSSHKVLARNPTFSRRVSVEFQESLMVDHENSRGS